MPWRMQGAPWVSRCLHPSSEETLPKRCGRSARAPAGWPLPPLAHRRSAGWPRAEGLRGLARFRVLVQEILCQKDGEVCQGSEELPSATRWGLSEMQGSQELGASRGGGGAPWDLGTSPWETLQEETRGEEVCQEPERAGLCCPLAPLAVGVPARAPRGLCPSSGETGRRHWGGLPGPGHARWAALCMVPAHPGVHSGQELAASGACLVWGPKLRRPCQRD